MFICFFLPLPPAAPHCCSCCLLHFACQIIYKLDLEFGFGFLTKQKLELLRQDTRITEEITLLDLDSRITKEITKKITKKNFTNGKKNPANYSPLFSYEAFFF